MVRDNIYIYLIDLPDGVRSTVLPCLDGYTIYINQNLSDEEMVNAYDHEIEHIDNGDYDNGYAARVSDLEMHYA